MRIIYFVVVLFAIVACDTDSEKYTEIVYINDGAIQCESDGMSVIETAQVLIDNGIDVIKSQCGYLSGVVVAAQCGLGDININLHTIPIQNLPDAQSLGFESVLTLRRDDDIGYVVIECPE